MSCTLITGASGAVGSALLPLCLENPAAEVKLLLRAGSPEHLEQRLQELRRFSEWPPAKQAPEERLEAFRGDVRLVRWGLEPAEYRRLTTRVTHIIHAAGNVRLNEPLDEARRSAVEGVRHAIQLARDCQQHGQFAKLDVVSTVGVAGRSGGRIFERPYQPQTFHNTYEQAKSEAENLLLEEMSRGLPATVHRPSMVVGDSRNGRIVRFQVFYHLSDFFCGLRTRGTIPDTGSVKLDVIPADYVAHAICVASSRPETAGRILHLCTGPEGSWTLAQYSERLRQWLAGRGRTLPPLRRLPSAEFRRWCAQSSGQFPAEAQRFLQGLPYLLDYLDEEQLFDNTETSRYLSAMGLRVPALEDYLPRVMEVYWDQHPGQN